MTDKEKIDDLPDKLETPQAEQYGQLIERITTTLEKHDVSFNELKEHAQKEIKGQAAEIARLSNDIKQVQADYAKRFMAIAEHYQGGGEYRGPFRDAQQAEQFGRLAAAVIKRDNAALAEMQKADILPGQGTQGGYLLNELLIQAIIRNVEEAGVFERNCPAMPVNVLKGGVPKRSSGLTVYYPDYGVAATPSEPTFGRGQFDLKRHVVACEVDQWMLASDLAIALADFIATEIGYALALAQDTNWFMGDGTSTYCGYTGLFKSTDLLTVTGDAGHDTFAEVIAESTYYLGQVLGTAPLWVHNAGPKWFMHLKIFFDYLGVRDSTGQPIANIIGATGKPPFYLMGYPVEPVQVAPSTTAVSTVLALFGSIQRACGVYRHAKAVEVLSSEHVKFYERLLALLSDVPQDMVILDGNGVVQLKTAAT